MKYLMIAILVIISLPAAASDLDRARPESVGMSSERLERITKFIKQYIDDKKIAGITTLVARKGKIVHFETMGKLNLKTGEPLKNDSLFRIYSMTKPVVTAAAMILHEEGKFQLNEPVANYLPAFKNTKVLVDGKEVAQSHPFTIRELMSHTAGFSYGIFGDTTIDKAYRKVGVLESVNLEEMVKKLGKIPLMHQPGTKWEYSLSVDVLGRFIEVVSGMSLDDFMEQRVFKPLNMKDTFFRVPANKLDRFGTNHARNKDGVLIVNDIPEPFTYTKDVTFLSGGGGLVSTALDYLKFSQMMLNGGKLNGVRLLSPKTVEIMRSNHLPDGVNETGLGERPGDSSILGYGLGFGVLMNQPLTTLGSKGTFSWGGAASTIFWIDPKEELVGILMAQMMRSPYRLRNEIKNLVYQAVIE